MGEIFPAGTEPLANYNSAELSTSIGWIVLQCITGGGSYLLTPQAWDSDPLQGELSGATLSLDHDYDMTLGRQLVIWGKTQVSVPCLVEGGAGGGTVSITVKIRKWNGTTETDLATGTAVTMNPGVGATQGYNGVCILDIPQTIFRKGETLRVTILATKSDAGSHLFYYHNPRDVAVYTSGTTIIYSALRVPIPTKINI